MPKCEPADLPFTPFIYSMYLCVWVYVLFCFCTFWKGKAKKKIKIAESVD